MKYDPIVRALYGGRDDQCSEVSFTILQRLQDLGMRYSYQRAAGIVSAEYRAAAELTDHKIEQANEHFNVINKAHIDLIKLVQK